MIGWLIALSYGTGTFGTWLAGAARIGARLEEIRNRRRSIADMTTPMFREGLGAFMTGLAWPLALPIFLAFNKGRSLGLKKKQMRALLDEAEAELARIKKQEGWS